MKLRKFICLKSESGRDDFGFSGLTFDTVALVKGRIYTEVDREENVTFANTSPCIIDADGCCRNIDQLIKDGKIEEVQNG